MKGVPWTPSEELFLREHYGKLSYAQIAKHLGRNVLAVKYRVKTMGLFHPERYSSNNVRDNEYMEKFWRELYG